MAAISDFFDGMHGVIFPFGGTVAPGGFLMCDGAAVSRTQYVSLFAAIGTAFGEGDGTTTFNVPDLRGEFMRGADGGRGVDGGRVLGTAQEDAFQGHFHDVTSTTAVDYPGSGGGMATFRAGGEANHGRAQTPITDGVSGTPRTAVETRPRNVAVNYIIKT